MTFEYLPSPCLSVNWKALTSLNTSSTLRPTGRSFTVICRTTPCNENHGLLLVHSQQEYVYISNANAVKISLAIRVAKLKNQESTKFSSQGDLGTSAYDGVTLRSKKSFILKLLDVSLSVYVRKCFIYKTVLKNITIKVGLNTTIMVGV